MKVLELCWAVIALVEAVWIHENDRSETCDMKIGPKSGPTAYTCTKGTPLPSHSTYCTCFYRNFDRIEST